MVKLSSKRSDRPTQNQNITILSALMICYTASACVAEQIASTIYVLKVIAIPVSLDFWAIAFGEMKGKVAIAIFVSRDF